MLSCRAAKPADTGWCPWLWDKERGCRSAPVNHDSRFRIGDGGQQQVVHSSTSPPARSVSCPDGPTQPVPPAGKAIGLQDANDECRQS